MALSVEQVGKNQSGNLNKFNYSADKPSLKQAELYPAKEGCNSDDLVSDKKTIVPKDENKIEQKQEEEGFFSSIWNWIKNLFTWSKKEEVEKTQESSKTEGEKDFPIKNPSNKVQELIDAGVPIAVGGKVYRGYNEVNIKEIDSTMIVFNDKGEGYTGKIGSYKYKNGIRVKSKFLGIF